MSDRLRYRSSSTPRVKCAEPRKLHANPCRVLNEGAGFFEMCRGGLIAALQLRSSSEPRESADPLACRLHASLSIACRITASRLYGPAPAEMTTISMNA